jgi:hypothetical protein
VSAATDGWVYMTHADVGGTGRFPDDPAAIELLKARGWVLEDEVPEHLDADAPNRDEPAAEPDPDPPVEQLLEPVTDDPAEPDDKEN